MKDDIKAFRKLVNLLTSEGKYTIDKICSEAHISYPTIDKILNTDVSELKIRASTLGIIQDFLKKHVNTFKYAGITPEEEPKQKRQKKVKVESIPEALPEDREFDSAQLLNESSKKIELSPEKEEILRSFADLLKELAELVPCNMKLTIQIN